MLAKKSDPRPGIWKKKLRLDLRRAEAGNAVAEEKKGSRWVRALRSIKCSETVKGKGGEAEELAEEENLQTPRGLLLRVNSCSHLPFNANTNKGERTLYKGQGDPD